MTLPDPLYGFVVEQERRLTKKGDSYFWQVVLRTEIGNIKAFMWNAPNDVEINPEFPHLGEILHVTSFKDQMVEKASIVINSFVRVAKDALPEKCKRITEFERASDDEIDEAIEIITDKSLFECENNYRFLMYCLKQVEGKKLRACPAASAIHHNYYGGLVIHTAEVLQMCRAVADVSKRYSFINRDVLFTSAILHDIGKVETYSISDVGMAQSDVTEKMIGHLFYGMSLVHKAGIGNANYNPVFVNEVLHCIASHHGLPEWGSLKVVQSVEAGILSRMDYLSSRNGMVEHMLKEAVKSSQPLASSFSIYGDPYFASSGMKKYVGESSDK